MMCADRKREKTEDVRLVRDVVEKHKKREIPLTHESTLIGQLPEAIEWFRHTRQLYVVDDNGRLLGNITLARLVMYTFASSHGTSMSSRQIMDLITCECAGDLMTVGTLSARMDDDLDDLLELMVDRNVEEVPVVDDDGKVVSDLTMIDLLRAGG